MAHDSEKQAAQHVESKTPQDQGASAKLLRKGDRYENGGDLNAGVGDAETKSLLGGQAGEWASS